MINPVAEGAAQILEGAADLIENVGHCKHEYWYVKQTPEGPMVTGYCLFGAVSHVANRLFTTEVDWEQTTPYTFADAAIRVNAAKRLRHRGGTGVAHWNDHPDRTPAEVIDFLRDTAKAVHNGEITPKEILGDVA